MNNFADLCSTRPPSDAARKSTVGEYTHPTWSCGFIHARSL